MAKNRLDCICIVHELVCSTNYLFFFLLFLSRCLPSLAGWSHSSASRYPVGWTSWTALNLVGSICESDCTPQAWLTVWLKLVPPHPTNQLTTCIGKGSSSYITYFHSPKVLFHAKVLYNKVHHLNHCCILPITFLWFHSMSRQPPQTLSYHDTCLSHLISLVLIKSLNSIIMTCNWET
jgi:hypothetical protein